MILNKNTISAEGNMAAMPVPRIPYFRVSGYINMDIKISWRRLIFVLISGFPAARYRFYVVHSI